MTSEPDESVWYYDRPGSLAGALQRGLGRGAYRALRDPAAPAVVLACVERDHRWCWQVDERAVYLARLIRDLALPVAPLLALLRAHPVDDDNTFEHTLEVLGALGRAGDRDAVDGLRAYVHDGVRWVDVLESIAGDWPRELWDDLLPVARTRLVADPPERVLWLGPPWRDWATVDDRIAAGVATHPRPARSRPLGHLPTGELLTMLRSGGSTDQQRLVLRELNRRGPQPALLALVDALPVTEVHGPLGRAVRLLGAEALPLARRWATPPTHPMVWTGYLVLAEHGDESDIPTLLAGLDWLDSRPDDLCGYDSLADGLARIGGPAASAAVPRLRRAWFTPHSFERAAYLRALTALAPDEVQPLLKEGLWDCESEVRRFAAAHVPLDGTAREQLRQLRDDPIETAEVRATAAARLDPAEPPER